MLGGVTTRVSSAIAMGPAHDTSKSSLLGWELHPCIGAREILSPDVGLNPTQITSLPLQPHAHSCAEGKTLFVENTKTAVALSVSLEGMLHW